MKKTWISAAALVMGICLLSGCGGTKSEDGAAQTVSDGNVLSAYKLSFGEHPAADYVTLGNYKGLEISASKVSYDEEDYEIQTKQVYFGYNGSAKQITDRPVALLDMVNIDYEGKKDGVAFDGGTAQGANLLIGSGQFIDGFEDGLIGVMPGETVDLDLTFPEAYGNADLAGQAVVFTVTVNYIAEMEDAGVGAIGIADVNTVDALRAHVKNVMDQQAEDEYLTAAQDEVWTQIMEEAVFEELPESMIRENKEYYALMLDKMAANYGMDAKTYVEAYGQNYDEVLDEYAELYSKQILVVQAIADAEGLDISEEALDTRIQEYADSVGIDVADMLNRGLTKEDYRKSFLYEDVMNYLVDNGVKVNN